MHVLSVLLDAVFDIETHDSVFFDIYCQLCRGSSFGQCNKIKNNLITG